MVLTANMLSRVRHASEHLLGATASVLRRVETPDTSGGRSVTWQTVATYPCSYAREPLRPVERESGVRVQAFTYWQFLFPATADIGPSDRIAVGARTFEVVGTGHNSDEVLYEVICQEIL